MPQRTPWRSQLRWRRLVSAPQLRIETVNRFPQGRRKSATKMRPKPSARQAVGRVLPAIRGPQHVVSLNQLATHVVRGLPILRDKPGTTGL